jgi:fructose-1,6-bisphosphatase/inositol monophosphatase family enzyme
MQAVSAETLLPRFQRLRDADIEMKSPGEVVTIADREAERRLSPQLTRLLPGSRVVGEEQASLDPSVLNGLDSGDVWLVDPLDGTANFVAGSAQFAMIVALLRQGQTIAAWILEPVSGMVMSAMRGGGAYVGATRIRAPQDVPDAAAMRGIIKTRFLPDDIRASIEHRSSSLGAMLVGLGCAGVEYPAVARAEQHYVLYWRTLPWDHAAGTLLLTEAGGCALRLDGSPYLPADRRLGLLVASNPGIWSATRDLLFGAAAPAHGRSDR